MNHGVNHTLSGQCEVFLLANSVPRLKIASCMATSATFMTKVSSAATPGVFWFSLFFLSHRFTPSLRNWKPLTDEWLFVFSQARQRRPSARTDKRGHSKTFAIIRGIISPTPSDPWGQAPGSDSLGERDGEREREGAAPQVVSHEHRRFAGHIVGTLSAIQVTDRQTRTHTCTNTQTLPPACQSVEACRRRGSLRTEPKVCTGGLKGGLEINTSCFLSWTGSATVAVPLSPGAQAAPREEERPGEEERETAVRPHKGRGREGREGEGEGTGAGLLLRLSFGWVK